MEFAQLLAQHAGPEAGSALGGLCCMMTFGIISLLSFALWIWMLIDCISNEPSEGNDKIIWILVIVLAGVIGALIYYLVRRPKRIEQYGK